MFYKWKRSSREGILDQVESQTVTAFVQGKKGIAMGKNIAAITKKRNIASGKLREERKYEQQG